MAVALRSGCRRLKGSRERGWREQADGGEARWSGEGGWRVWRGEGRWKGASGWGAWREEAGAEVGVEDRAGRMEEGAKTGVEDGRE